MADSRETHHARFSSNPAPLRTKNQGIGGDNSDNAIGVFLEGAITEGGLDTTAETHAAVHASVVAAAYSLSS